MVALQIALAGLLGTLAMMMAMSLIHHARWANADMVRAVGSLFTRRLDNAYGPGLIVHFLMGAAFAFLYAFAIGNAPQLEASGAWALGALLGVAHGTWVGLLLVIEVAEYHPLKRFRDAGIGVAVAHAIGHVAYGIMVGVVISWNWAPIHEAVQEFNVGASLADFVGFTAVWLPLFGLPFAFAAYVCLRFRHFGAHGAKSRP